MRARLLVIVLVVVGLVAVGLGGLLAWTTAQAAQQGFFTRRLTDTVYLASLVQRPLTEATGGDLDALLERYRQVYGVTVHVVTADGAPFAPSAAPELVIAGLRRAAAALRAGSRAGAEAALSGPAFAYGPSATLGRLASMPRLPRTAEAAGGVAAEIDRLERRR